MSSFDKVAAMKAGYFIQKETPTQVLSCEKCKFFKNTYSEKQL